MRRLLVAGVAQCGSIYPNAQRTLAILRGAGTYAVLDEAHWLPPNTQLWQVAQSGAGARARVLGGLLWKGLLQALRVIARTPRTAVVYVPYPSLFLLWWLSWVPRRRRPRLVADVYISIWDSMFRDRSTHREDSPFSRFVHAAETRALRTADRVLVDTEANVRELTSVFALPAGRVLSLPLAVDESRFLAIATNTASAARRVRVLFVGTMIPLHGIDVVLGAMRALRDDDRVEFRLLGDGQLGPRIDEFLQESRCDRATWLRGHFDLDVLAREIAAADICIGVFGGHGKAARVLPFKLYLYFAAGRAVISQAQLSTPAQVPDPPMEAVDHADAASLATAITTLIENPARRDDLARASRAYYRRWLSNARLLERWNDVFDAVERPTHTR